MGKFVIKESKAGFRFNLVAANGETIAASQVYKTASGCKNGIASVQKNAPVAAVENQTAKDFKVEKIRNSKFMLIRPANSVSV